MCSGAGIVQTARMERIFHSGRLGPEGFSVRRRGLDLVGMAERGHGGRVGDAKDVCFDPVDDAEVGESVVGFGIWVDRGSGQDYIHGGQDHQECASGRYALGHHGGFQRWSPGNEQQYSRVAGAKREGHERRRHASRGSPGLRPMMALLITCWLRGYGMAGPSPRAWRLICLKWQWEVIEVMQPCKKASLDRTPGPGRCRDPGIWLNWLSQRSWPAACNKNRRWLGWCRELPRL